MLLSDVMEHRVPDLVVAQHRTAAIEEAGQGQQHKMQLEAKRLHSCCSRTNHMSA
jgi:hypothetical protein